MVNSRAGLDATASKLTAEGNQLWLQRDAPVGPGKRWSRRWPPAQPRSQLHQC